MGAKKEVNIGEYTLTLCTPADHYAPFFDEGGGLAFVAVTHGGGFTGGLLYFYLDLGADGTRTLEMHDPEEGPISPVLLCAAHKLLREYEDA